MESATPRNGQIFTFYSYKGGVGRTMALANVAWILASTGRRVLTVDCDFDSPGLHLYFRPFLADRKLRRSPGVIDAMARYRQEVDQYGPLSAARLARVARVQQHAIPLERYEFPNGGSIDFIPCGQQDPEYAVRLTAFDWSEFWDQFDAGSFLWSWAAGMRAEYDVTLVDSSTGLGTNAAMCTLEIPDVVVNCFTFNHQNLDGAVAAANSIRERRNQYGEPVRVFPVPTRVEDGEAAKLDRWRANAQQRFSDVVADLGYSDDTLYWGAIEIPYKVSYAYEETLATLGDRPHLENTLLAAYQRLAGELIGEPCRYEGPTEAVRRSWLGEFERPHPVEQGTVLIGYLPRDRIWAEWIALQLRTVGHRGVLQDITADDAVTVVGDSDRALLLLSQESVRTPHAHAFWSAAQRREPSGSGPFLVPIRLDGFRLPQPYDSQEPVDMFNVSRQHSRDALLAQFDLRDVAPASEAMLGAIPRPRFPFEPARVWRAPSRNATFTGRDAILEQLRERLNASTAMNGPTVLQGIGGVGKTQIVTEYLHRFAADYDIVWWISAEQPRLVPSALADLANALDLSAADVAGQVGAVLEALRLGRPSRRWAVVFDNIEDPKQLLPYVPAGQGDVIVTTRGGDWSGSGWTIEVNTFSRTESIDLIARWVPSIDRASADVIADKLGDLPLAVEQAAGWLAATAMSPDRYLAILDEHLPRILETPPASDYPHPAAEIWRISQQRLRMSNPAAAHLVELCACLAPEPIPTDLLSSPGMLQVLSQDDPAMRDPLLYGALVREITRFGLARLDPTVRALRMHRLVQQVIRNDLDPEVRQERRRQVHSILAAERRGVPDDRLNWDSYRRMLPHLEPTGALESDDRDVHNLVIDMVRALRYRGDLTSSHDLAVRALHGWTVTSGADDASVLRLRAELANVLRQLGDYQAALDIDIDVRERMERVFGGVHPYSLVSLRGVAADLRGLGRYRQARDLDEDAVAKWQAAMGRDHDETHKAINNLSLSYLLTGDFRSSLLLAEEVVEIAGRLLGQTNQWTVIYRINHGRVLRETGDLVRSRETLETVVSTCRREFGDLHGHTLAATKNLAVTLRRLGHLDRSRELSEVVRRSYEQQLGADHPNTLAAELELACVRSARGEHSDAAVAAGRLCDRYGELMGVDHPHSLAAANNLGIFLVRDGGFTQAGPLLAETAGRFAEVLGEEHPYALLCAANHANVLFAVGDHDRAREVDERCYAGLRARLGEECPAVVAAAANLATTRVAAGLPESAAQLYADALRAATLRLGPGHPYVAALHDGTRISSDIEPAAT
ncbi:FxSxx-COOH system tetratricopeptide repeat protein [Solwaraspora sp. WMMD792]|uniref:FxSxx-COOH system tetratricopeptide repeat protein n=1 Tax=Solwaraspora sp. WMMD792 TaxID=3016099 RepID=UPI0024170929|nr:FxSxx-COOH system tetratricopeptide repeat protein [Solwaraspora sp. WMMD792]MDG4772255.1 FxSxx-COOH system tetratricopeptide repeat protein [Solwaraspora sp. WMMD792]